MLMSIWEKESFYAPKEVIIIGCGLMGLWCAHELKQLDPLMKILILEKGIVPTGASTRNAGFACFGSPTELIHDAALNGENEMLKLVEMRYKSIQKIRRTFADRSINYDPCGGYECLNSGLTDLDALDEKLAWLNKSLRPITTLGHTFVHANEKLAQYGFSGFDAMIENKLEAALHSGKLVQALIKKVQDLGVEILTGIHVERFEETSSGVQLFTKQQLNLSAQQLLICANAFTQELLPDLQVMPARGQVIVTKPIPHLKMKGTFHYDQGFYYFRNLGDRVLLGGARNIAFDEEAIKELATTPIIQKELERFLAAHILPNIPFEIEHRWSGIMGLTENKMPLVHRSSDRVTAAIACNGMGVALCPIIAETVAANVYQQL